MFRHGHATQRCPSPDLPRDEGMPPGRFFREIRSRTAARGELRLALAVLEDAVSSLNGSRDPWKIPPRLFRWEAEQWIASSDRAPLFSFESVCAILRLDSEEVRERIRRWGAIYDEDTHQPIERRA